jgi:uncharacterized Zn ribbon protein
MKKLLAVSILVLCCAVSNAQSPAMGSKDTSMGMSTGSTMNNQSMMNKEGMVTMKDDKMMVMKDGNWVPMTKTMRYSGGCKVMKDGTVMKKDGSKMMMTNGMTMSADGHMMDADGKMMMKDSTGMNKM